MRSLRRRLRACTWLALVAMLTLALGPTISRLTLPEEASHGDAFALQAPMDHAAMHHHSMHHDAMAMAAMHAHHHLAASMPVADAPPPPSPPQHQHTLEHCALCAVAASAFAVAPSPPVVLAATTQPRAVAIPRERGIAPGRTPWSPATSRGPPVLA